MEIRILDADGGHVLVIVTVCFGSGNGLALKIGFELLDLHHTLGTGDHIEELRKSV